VNSSELKQVSRPTTPTAPGTSRTTFKFQLDTDLGGSATYSADSTSFTLGDVNDGEPGAHRYLKTSYTGAKPSMIRDFRFYIQSWQQTFSLRHPISISIRNASDEEQGRVDIGYPYPFGEHRIEFQAGFSLENLSNLRFRFHVRHSVRFDKWVICTNTFTPRFYAITRVNASGFESRPIFFEVSRDGVALNENFFVYFYNLPASNWRLYRRDAAGVYRLVDSGTATSYTDYKLDSELGDRLIENEYPDEGTLAIGGFQRRVVVAHGNKLYISEPGTFRFGEDAEVVEVEDEIIALAVVRGVLHYGTRQGWYSLIGWGDTLTVQQVSSEPPPAGYVGERLALRSGGFVSYDNADRAIASRLTKVIAGTNAIYALSEVGKVYLRVISGHWVQLDGVAGDIAVDSGVLYVQRADGVYSLTGSGNAFSLEFTIPFDTPMQVYEARLEGSGNATLEILTRSGWRTVSGSMPLLLGRQEHYYYELPVRVSGSGTVSRLLLEMEPRRQLERT
jgi:hypothetical protein